MEKFICDKNVAGRKRAFGYSENRSLVIEGGRVLVPGYLE